jgi:hypothetical protein
MDTKAIEAASQRVHFLNCIIFYVTSGKSDGRDKAIKELLGIDKDKSQELVNRTAAAAGPDPALRGRLFKIEKLRLAYVQAALHSGIDLRKIDAVRQWPAKLERALANELAACLEVAATIAGPGEKAEDLKEWLSYYIPDIVKLLPSPPPKKWWQFFAS